MTGVGLVGFSGSLIKDVVKEPLINYVGSLTGHSSDLPPPEPIEKPEATTVLVGKVSSPIEDATTCSLLSSIGIFFVLFAQVL